MSEYVDRDELRRKRWNEKFGGQELAIVALYPSPGGRDDSEEQR